MPHGIERITLPTDLADGCEQVYSHALRIALATGAQLKLLHVHPSPADEVPWTRLPSVHELLVRWGLLGTEAGVEDYEALGLHVRAEHRVDPRPVQGAIRGLEGEHPDLLIVGTHRRQGLARLLRGSVAEAIARRSGVHSLFVGRDTRGFVDIQTGAITLDRVLVPVGSSVNLPAVTRVLAHILGALQPGPIEVLLLTVGEHFDLEVGQAPADTRVRFTVEHRRGPVVSGILDAAAAHDSQLICMPTRDRDSLRDTLLGTRTEQVLRQSDCPVLALRDPRQRGR